jgi:hypothetical protein
MQARARATAGFSQNCRTDRIGPVDRSPRRSSGSIQPYSTSGDVGCAPSSTSRSGFFSTHPATSATWAMKLTSPRRKWSDGKIATIASGLRHAIQWAG